MAFIDLDRPRKLKLGFNSLAFLKSEHGFKNFQDVFKEMQLGDITLIPVFLQALMIGDHEGLDSSQINNLLDDYIDKNGVEKLKDILQEAVTESSFVKGLDSKKKKK